MKSDYSNLLLNEGGIRINNLKFYQSTENKEIQDNEEGFKRRTQFIKEEDFIIFKKDSKDENYVNVSNESDHEPLMKMTKMEVSQRQFVPDTYIYCTSLSSDKNLFDNYDSCIEITDMNFFKLIGIELLKQRLIKMTSIQEKDYISMEGEIIYSKERKIDFKKTGISPYFVKDISFENEVEHRVVYASILNSPNDKLSPIDLVVPELRKYCKKVW